MFNIEYLKQQTFSITSIGIFKGRGWSFYINKLANFIDPLSSFNFFYGADYYMPS